MKIIGMCGFVDAYPIYEWIAEELDTEIHDYHDVGNIEINCPHCGDGYHNVVKHHSHFICTSCYSFSDKMEVCEWCNEGQLGGVSELSYVSGCEFCDGKSGWDKD